MEPIVKVVVNMTDCHQDYQVKQSRTLLIKNSIFKFASILQQPNTQDLYREVCGGMLDKVLQGNPTNCLVLGSRYDQTVLIGNPQQQGLLVKFMKLLFQKANEMTVEKDVGVTLSVIGVKGQKVFDLANGKNRNKELSAFQRENRVILVGLQTLPVFSVENIYEITSLVHQTNQTHIIFSVKVAHKQKNSDISNIKTGIFNLGFLLYQPENPLIKADFDSLNSKLLHLQEDLSFSSKTTKLSMIIGQFLVKNSEVCLLLLIDPKEDFFKNSDLLRYGLRSIAANTQKDPQQLVLIRQKQDRLRKIVKNVLELKKEIAVKQASHQQKIKTLSEMLGISDLKEIIQKPTWPLPQKVINFKQAIKGQQFLLSKQQKLTTQFQKQSEFLFQKQRKKYFQDYELRQQIKQLEEQIEKKIMEIQNIEEETEELKLKTSSNQQKAIERIVEQSQEVAQQQAVQLFNLPFAMKCVSVDYRTKTEQNLQGKAQILKSNQQQFKNKQKLLQQRLRKIKINCQRKIKTIEQEMIRYQHECIQYFSNKDKKLQQIENQIVQLYYIWSSQQKLIQQFQQGKWTQVPKRIYVPFTETPKQLTRQRFPLQVLLRFFDVLGKRNILTSSKDNNYIKIQSHLLTKKYKERKKPVFNLSSSQKQPKFSGVLQKKQVSESISSFHLNYSDSLSTFQLKQNATLMQKEIFFMTKSMKEKNKQKIHLNQEIQTMRSLLDNLIKEKNKYKQLHFQQIRQKRNQKVILESQKRIIQKGTVTSEKVRKQPQKGMRPRTSSLIRILPSYSKTTPNKFSSPELKVLNL